MEYFKARINLLRGTGDFISRETIGHIFLRATTHNKVCCVSLIILSDMLFSSIKHLRALRTRCCSQALDSRVANGVFSVQSIGLAARICVSQMLLWPVNLGSGMMKKALVGGLLFCLVFMSQAALAAKRKARKAEQAEAAAIVAAQNSRVVIPQIDQALHLSDFPDMAPRPDLRDKLASVSDFIQSEPVDGNLATEKTQVWMAYTKSTIYFVFICYDSHPNLIRNHLARREDIFNDDTVSVLLDPFQDRRIGVYFRVNPSGVQAEASWRENNFRPAL